MELQLTPKEKLARSKVCLPLDGINFLQRKDAPTGEKSVESQVIELSQVVGLFKVGKETYTRFGPESLLVVQNYGVDVFLDLKFHDIPNTVQGAARAAAEQQDYMFNVHASGGYEMMKAAVEGANSINISSAIVPRIVGVTVLTSLDNLRYIQNSLPVIKSLPISEENRNNITQLLSFPYHDAIDAQIELSKEKDQANKIGIEKFYNTKTPHTRYGVMLHETRKAVPPGMEAK